LLPALLSVFRQQHPNVQIRVTVADTLAVLNQVEHGQAHLGLVGGKSDNPHLEFRSFACDQLVLVVPADHPWRRRRRVSVQELCEQPLILREAGSGSRWCLERALTQAGKSAQNLRVALELGSNEAIKEAVESGIGVSILSRWAVRKELRYGTLKALKFKEFPMTRDFSLLFNRNSVSTYSVDTFLSFLKSFPYSRLLEETS
jgi:DNA-binding transcriptional LysR family regulator